MIQRKFYFRHAVVTSDGFVSSVRFGLINILDKSIEEASEVIAEKYRRTTGFKDPIVAISLLSVPEQRVYVQGQVETPKMVVLPFEMELTLASVLAEAGGLTKDADLTRIKILQRLPGGEVQMQEVDATGFAQRNVRFSGPTLKSGDNVIVPQAEVFTVSGEAMRPGVVNRRICQVPQGQPIRLSHALAAVGGFSAKANRKLVSLLHIDEDGKKSKKIYDGEAIDDDAQALDPVIKDSDRIHIPASEGIMLMGAVNSPGIYYIPVGPTTLSRLIGLAGGFQTFAKKQEARLMKKSGPGAPILVNMRLIIEEGKRELDQILEPGDSVFVPGEPN